MNTGFGKLMIIVIIVIAYLIYSDSKKDKQLLQEKVEGLSQQIVEQKEKDKLNALQIKQDSQKQLDIAQKQLAESQKHTEKINQQMEELSDVTEKLEEKQKIEQEMLKLAQITQKETLIATHLAKGLQLASGLKMQIAEYYMMNGKYPKNNTALNIAKPSGFASGSVKSLWVSRGKIIVIFNDQTGIDKGSLSLSPKEKSNQIQWNCTTLDYKKISTYIPQCKYLTSRS